MKTYRIFALIGILALGLTVPSIAQEAAEKPQDANAAIEAAGRADLLVITNQKLESAWSKFANWKTATGRPTKIVTTEEIEAEFEGPDLQAKIRECCLKHIETMKTRWVVLGGDSSGDGGIVPDRDTDHSKFKMLPYDNIPTDLYYISETDWDANDDGKYGVFADDMEEVSYVNPTASIGRIPVRTAKDVIAYTDKVIQYESLYPVGDFAKRMVVTCTVEQAYPKLGTSMDAIAEAWPTGSISQFFAHHTAWDDSEKGDYDLTRDNWAEMINDRQASKIHIHGHGLLHCWVLEDDEMVKKDCVAELTNERAYPIITTVSCLTGQYDDKQDPSIVESMLRMPKAGAIAVLAPSREGVAFMMKQSDFAKMMLEGKMDGTTESFTKFWEAALTGDFTLGEAFRKVKIDMTDNARENNGFHMCQCELNLLGDPSLAIHPAPPSNFENLKISRTDKVVKIRGVKEARVCVWDGKDDYQLVETNRYGYAKVTLKSDPSKYQIAVSAKGHNTYYQPLVGLAVKGKTVAEFKEYIGDRLTGVTEKQLDIIANAVDQDDDGMISKEEFEQRRKSIQGVASELNEAAE